MNRSRERAVASIERWRRFQQAREAIALDAGRRDARLAQQAHAQAASSANDARLQRSALLASPALDLARWQAAAEIEHVLWQRVDACATEKADAEAREREALERHRLAHARTRVVEQRRERLQREANVIAETRQSDDLADLRRTPENAP